MEESLVPNPNIQRKASVKKRKKPPPMLGIDGSVTLSPVNSLESPRTTSYLEGTPPPLEPLYNGMSHPNLMSIDNNWTLNRKQPPSYEDCINAVTQMYSVIGMDPFSIRGLGSFTNNGMSGKTSLHWAAAVNNVEAVQVLLAHGANRDAQDMKGETPLFLAAREGSRDTAKTLLEHFANRDIMDAMDQLPKDVAREKHHFDIVRLLEEYFPPSPQLNVPTNGPMGSPGMMPLGGMIGSTKSVKQKKRPKVNTIGLSMKEGESLGPDPSIRRKASVKKRKEPPPMLMQGIDGSVTLSPVNSLESPRTTTYL